MPSYAVVGASRGLGYGLLKQLSADPDNVVFGVVRGVEAFREKISKDVPSRKNIHAVYGDLADLASLRAAADAVSAVTGGSLDVLIANAAFIAADFDVIVKPGQDWDIFDKTTLDSFKINALGNIHLMSVFTPLIQKGHLKKIVAISSGMGDINFTVEANVRFQAPYSISKAALNMAIAKFHVQYRKEGILFMGISPGVVDTGVYDHFDVTDPHVQAGSQEMMTTMKNYAPHWEGPISPEESASKVLEVVDNATIEANGGLMVSHLGTKRWL